MLGYLMANPPYQQVAATPTGSRVIEPAPVELTTAAIAGAGTTSVVMSTTNDQGGISAINQAGALGLIPPGTSTQAAGWLGPAPINTNRQVGDFAAEAPSAGVDQTPFRRPVFQRIWQGIFPPVKNEWAVNSQGLHGQLPGPTAAMPPGLSEPGTAARGNSWRIQPKPWSADVYVGQATGES